MTIKLGKRELEVLKLSANGLMNKEIATNLLITTGTVKNTLTNIRNKFGATNTTHAVLLAIKRGDIKLEDIE